MSASERRSIADPDLASPDLNPKHNHKPDPNAGPVDCNLGCTTPSFSFEVLGREARLSEYGQSVIVA